MADPLEQLMQMLSTAGGMVPRAPQPYPGMRPAAGGNAFAGLPQLAQAGPPGMAQPAGPAGPPGAWPGAPGFWNQPPPAGIPAQEPWRLGGDNVVSPRTGLGMNAAGIYGRGGAMPAPAGNRDTVVPAGPAGVDLNALIRLLQQVGIGQAPTASPLNLMAPR